MQTLQQGRRGLMMSCHAGVAACLGIQSTFQTLKTGCWGRFAGLMFKSLLNGQCLNSFVTRVLIRIHCRLAYQQVSMGVDFTAVLLILFLGFAAIYKEKLVRAHIAMMQRL